MRTPPRPPAVDGPATSAAAPFVVAFLLIPGFSMMALSSAVEPLRGVNRLLGQERYRWLIIGSAPGPVAAGNGLEVAAEYGLDDAPGSDMTVVVASLGVEDFREPRALAWLRRRRGHGHMIAAVSYGPLLLARAGLLAGRRATVHWELQLAFADEFPEIALTADLYCVDGDLLTAAGGTASMDMMLALISEREGRDVAADVAEQFLHGPVRASNAMQRQDVRWRYQVTDRRLVAAIRLMEGSLALPVRIGQIGALVGISERQLERLFEAEFGKKPSQFYMEVRLKRARQWLVQSTQSLEEISEKAGFSSPGHFSRAFKAWAGESPSTVRKRRRSEDGGIMQEHGDPA